MAPPPSQVNYGDGDGRRSHSTSGLRIVELVELIGTDIRRGLEQRASVDELRRDIRDGRAQAVSSDANEDHDHDAAQVGAAER